MEQKIIKQYFNKMNESVLKEMFKNYIIEKKIKFPGFSKKNQEKVPKSIFINSLVSDSKNLNDLLQIIQDNNKEKIDFTKYDSISYEELENVLEENEIWSLMSYYMLNDNSENKDKVIKYLYRDCDQNHNDEITTGQDSSQKKIVDENIKINDLNGENSENDENKEQIKALIKEIAEYKALNKKLTQQNKELTEKNKELGKKSKELNIKNKEINIKNREINIKNRELNKNNEELIVKTNDLNASLTKKVNENNLLFKSISEKESQIKSLIDRQNKNFEKFQIAVLYDVESNFDKENIYIVSDNHADEIISRFDKFKKIYVLERSVTEGTRRQLKKKERETKKNILEFVEDYEIIKEIIEGTGYDE